MIYYTQVKIIIAALVMYYKEFESILILIESQNLIVLSKKKII